MHTIWLGHASTVSPAQLQRRFGDARKWPFGQIGLALMFAGILVFVVTYAYWLFDLHFRGTSVVIGEIGLCKKAALGDG